MERNRYDEAAVSCGSASRPPQPPRQINYTCSQVQGALAHLASIDPIGLCNEAKIEHCRATRDLRSCGRFVKSVLISCGHASLCEECSQRCDVCPICRVPLPKDGNKLRLRLYYECIESGLISKRCDERFQDEKDSDKQVVPDIRRLYSLFNVALENNLNSLICHYVTDVCMDESAVSSDPVIAFLLDEVVVKDWCKQTFRNILSDLQVIYNITERDMKENLDSLLKFSVKLAGISNVLEVLESSFRNSLSAKLNDVHYLQENILKTKQHMEIMIWCINHQFLENVKSRYPDFASWRTVVRQRKTEAVKRAWPDILNRAVEPFKQQNSGLFIEDALLNLEKEVELTDYHEKEYQIESLQKEGSSSLYRSKIEGTVGCYPFENLRAACDILFLRGNSDLVVAKQAIFLYYLFDRHWSMPDENWRYIIDDFATTFNISRHSLLESLTFYLLDDCTSEALQEACRLLLEISGPAIHPKIAQVLLERGNPDAALMVLRWSGRDGARLESLGEAVTAVRVRVECGLLTEAFMYQRMVYTKAKEKMPKDESIRNATNDVKDECSNWCLWLEVLVTEICCLCIRRNLVDRIIELPWNNEEEKHIHKCLMDFAFEDPSTAFGSLLVVFYLQRYRYIDAYQVHQKLQSLEEDFISKNSPNDKVLSKMTSTSHWRAGLVGKGVELLPDVLQQKLKSGKMSEEVPFPHKEVGISETTAISREEESILTGFLVPHSDDSSFVLPVDNRNSSFKSSLPETPLKMSGSFNISNFKIKNFGASSPSTTFFSDADLGLKPKTGLSKSFNFDNVTTSLIQGVGSASPSPLTNTDRSSRVKWSSRLPSYQVNKVSPERGEDGFTGQFQDSSFSHSRAATPGSNQGIFTSLAQNKRLNSSLKPSRQETAATSLTLPANNLMDISWSDDKQFSSENVNANGGPRWRSDEMDEDDDYQSPDSYTGVASNTRSIRKTRRSRFSRR